MVGHANPATIGGARERAAAAHGAEFSSPAAGTEAPAPASCESPPLPDCLRHLAGERRWCVWRWEPGRNGRPTKPPRQPGGGHARNNASETWTTLEEARAAVAAGSFEGVGLMLLGLPGFAALDLDDVRDPDTGVLLPWAAEAVRRADSYAERTPSGRGLRILGRVGKDFPSTHRKVVHPGGGHFELYANLSAGSGRYITVSGERLAEAPDRLAPLDGLLEELHASREDARSGGTGQSGGGSFDVNCARDQGVHVGDGRPGADRWQEAFEDLPEWLRDCISHGRSGDRSGDFQAAVNALCPRVSIDAALEMFRAHPDGPASKYLGPTDRLEEELRRSWAKADESRRPGGRAEGIPAGFRLCDNGIYRRVEDKDGGHEWRRLCSPINVTALPRDASGRGWGRLVEVTDADGSLHRWAIPARLFAAEGAPPVIAVLYDLGADIPSKRGERTALLDMLNQWKPEARARTADRLGWADETCRAFVLGAGAVIGAEDVVHQAEHVPDLAAEMKAAGTLEQWRDGVAALAAGNPLVMVALSLAFAGPLLEPLAVDGGGLHLRGASSAGKSTLLRAAASVWGSPGFVGSWRATSNGLEAVASAANGTLLALDEMAEVSGREAGAAAYMVANGRAKSRASRAGTARPAARWRTAILSSGEISLADKMAEAGQRARAGQDVRLLDIAADGRTCGAFDALHGAPDGAAFADRLNRAAAEHYGTARPEFVRKLLDDFEGNKAAVRGALDTAERAAVERFGLGDDGQSRRAAKRMALVAAAGETATAFGLTGWRRGAATDAALEVLRLWMEARGGAGPAEAREAIERTRAFLVAHGASRFEAITECVGEAGRIVNRAGWRGDGVYYIAADAWRTEVHAGADPVRAAHHLRDAGLLVSGDGNKLMAKTPRSVEGRPRAYAVKTEIMGAGDD